MSTNNILDFIEKNKNKTFDVTQIQSFVSNMIESIPGQTTDFYIDLLYKFNTKFYIEKQKIVKTKVQTLDENGNTVTSVVENAVPTKQFINLAYYYGGNNTISTRPLSLLIQQVMSETIDFSKFREALPHKEDTKKYLEACKKLFSNVDGLRVGETATSFASYIQNIYSNIDNSVKPTHQMMYLYSAIGGTGKGVLMSRLQHFFKTYKMPVCNNARLNTRWQDGKYATNIATFVDEFFPTKSNEEDSICLVNNIIDNTEYPVEVKGKQPLFLKSNTTLCVGSNKKPYDANTRRFAIVEYNNYRLANKKFNDIDNKYLYTDYMPEDWDKVIYDAFTSCPFNTEFTDFTETIDENYADTVLQIRQFIKTNRDTASSCEFDCCTISDFASTFQYVTSNHYNPQDVKYMKKNLVGMLYNFVEKGLIKPVVKVNGSLQYSKYNWFEVAEIRLPDDEDHATPREIIDEEHPLKRTSLAWDYLIKDNTPIDPTDGSTKNDDDDIEAETESGHFYSTEDAKTYQMPVCTDKYSAPKFSSELTDEFLVSAVYKRDYKKQALNNGAELDRKSEHMLPAAFVFESDELSLEEQKNIADSIKKDNILSITYSGSKSIHILSWIKPEQRAAIAEDFKYYWAAAAERLFGKDIAEKMDRACASIARLTRLPNGYRKDKNALQENYFWNKNAIGIDLSNEIDIHRKELEDKKLQKAISRAFAKKEYDDSTPLINQLANIAAKSSSDSIKLAYEILSTGCSESGTNMIGAIGALKKLGDKFKPLVTELYDICHSQHPSNIH